MSLKYEPASELAQGSDMGMQREPGEQSHAVGGTRPVHRIITMIKWIRTRRLSASLESRATLWEACMLLAYLVRARDWQNGESSRIHAEIRMWGERECRVLAEASAQYPGMHLRGLVLEDHRLLYHSA